MTADPRIVSAILRNDFYSFIQAIFPTVSPGAAFQPSWHIETIAFQLWVSRSYCRIPRMPEVFGTFSSTEAPEVEGLIRLRDAGPRFEEVPVDMAARASGESKLRGGKAVKVVLTVVGTLLTARLLRRRRSR